MKTPVTLSEQDGVRYLHFDSPWVQGAMRLARPNQIELDYCRHMMAWLLFLDQPQQCLQLGLGAAALTKFILHQMPATDVTAVELSASVIAAAHGAFKLSRDHAKLTIVEADAQAFIARPTLANQFDVVQIDCYDAQARGPVCESQSFYDDVFRVMSPAGSVVAINLFGEHASFGRNLSRIQKSFNGRLITLPPVEAGNTIALAFKGPSISIGWTQIYDRASSVQSQYGLKATGWVNAMKNQLAQASNARAGKVFQI